MSFWFFISNPNNYVYRKNICDTMIKIFVSLILLIPICLLFSLTKFCLSEEYDNAAIGFGFGFVFSIVGYFLLIFNLFGK